MMEPDFEAAKLRVYEELGIWKPGEKCPSSGRILTARQSTDWWIACAGCSTRFSYSVLALTGFLRPDHDIPPPELTDAIAWQVLMAAFAKINCRLEPDRFGAAGIQLVHGGRVYMSSAYGDPDPKRALILALAGAGQGAHERS